MNTSVSIGTSVFRAIALLAAQAHSNSRRQTFKSTTIGEDEVLATANKYYDWLRK